jgi:AcrR family transcriptional regulator
MPTRRRTRALPKDPRQRLIAAALALAVEKGWRRIAMADIAAAAGLSLAETYRLFRSKFALLAGFRRDIDQAVLAGPAPSPDESVRDRLFDVLMRRFEALKPHRAALKVILRDSLGTPAPIKALPGLLRSMSWMLAAASIPTAGYRGRLTTRLVAALFLSIFPAFLRDESADLGTTMAVLDRRLRQVESLVANFGPIAARVRKSRT